MNKTCSFSSNSSRSGRGKKAIQSKDFNSDYVIIRDIYDETMVDLVGKSSCSSKQCTGATRIKSDMESKVFENQHFHILSLLRITMGIRCGQSGKDRCVCTEEGKVVDL